MGCCTSILIIVQSFRLNQCEEHASQNNTPSSKCALSRDYPATVACIEGRRIFLVSRVAPARLLRPRPYKSFFCHRLVSEVAGRESVPSHLPPRSYGM